MHCTFLQRKTGDEQRLPFVSGYSLLLLQCNQQGMCIYQSVEQLCHHTTQNILIISNIFYLICQTSDMLWSDWFENWCITSGAAANSCFYYPLIHQLFSQLMDYILLVNVKNIQRSLSTGGTCVELYHAIYSKCQQQLILFYTWEKISGKISWDS